MRRSGLAQTEQTHVHRRTSVSPFAFAASEELFEDVREEPVDRHVLAAGDQLAAADVCPRGWSRDFVGTADYLRV
jgi:hypothetical protein